MRGAMEKRKLGKTGIEVSELALGTWGLVAESYGTVLQTDIPAMFERALAMGIDVFDTSAAYGKGSIERLLGHSLIDKGATVITRWGTDHEASPPRRDFSIDFLKRQADESLARLKPSESGSPPRVVALLHNPSPAALRRPGTTETLKELKASGAIAAWGVSAGSAEVGTLAIEAGADVVSLAYNIIQVEPYRALKSKIEKAGVGLLFHSVLAYGLLTNRWLPGKVFGAIDHRSKRWPDGAVRTRVNQLGAIRPLVSGEIPTMRAAAVLYALAEPLCSSVVLGPRQNQQLDQLVRETRGVSLSEVKRTALEARLSDFGVTR